MQEEQQRILEMVQQGTITVEEAERLLAALETSSPAAPKSIPVPTTTIMPPQEARFRRYWEVPFAIGLILFGISVLCIGWGATIGLFTLGMLCLWSVLLVAAITAIAGFWSRSSRWVHIRITENDGDKIKISLPLPISLLEKGLGFAQRFTDEETRDNLNMAASLLSMLKTMPTDQPILIEVDDEDGDQIVVQLG